MATLFFFWFNGFQLPGLFGRVVAAETARIRCSERVWVTSYLCPTWKEAKRTHQHFIENQKTLFLIQWLTSDTAAILKYFTSLRTALYTRKPKMSLLMAALAVFVLYTNVCRL